MAKLIVSDPLAPRGPVLLEQAKGIEVANGPGLSPGALDRAVADADALAVRSGTEPAADMMAAGDELRVVGR